MLSLQYIPRNMHPVFALLCFVDVIHCMIIPYPSGLLHWHCGNLTIAPVPAKQPWWIWINTSCEFIMNDCITTTKQSTTKPCAYFLGYTVYQINQISKKSHQNHWIRLFGFHHRKSLRYTEDVGLCPGFLAVLYVYLANSSTSTETLIFGQLRSIAL